MRPEMNAFAPPTGMNPHNFILKVLVPGKYLLRTIMNRNTPRNLRIILGSKETNRLVPIMTIGIEPIVKYVFTCQLMYFLLMKARQILEYNAYKHNTGSAASGPKNNVSIGMRIMPPPKPAIPVKVDATKATDKITKILNNSILFN